MKAFREQGHPDRDPSDPPSTAPEETEQSLLMELESIWKLSSPFEQVVAARRKRLEQMDRLITAARRRIRELEGGALPAEAREREELKRQIQEVLLERDEILKIEYGISEMERIYRNVITTQQKELRAKEDALKARLEGFRKEIGMRDAEREAIAERERELDRRERELEEKLSSVGTKDAPRPSAAPESQQLRSSNGEEVTREQWLAAQHEIQDALLKLRGSGGDIVLPTAEGLRDLRMRATELEDSLETVGEEKARLEREIEELRAREQHVKEVLKEVDDLLGKLPDADIKRFARSEAFKKYTELMERLGL